MRVLAGWRNCECELVGLEEAMALATNAMQRAIPVLSALELDAAPRALAARADPDRSRVLRDRDRRDGGHEGDGYGARGPDKLRAGRYAAQTMLEAFAPYLGEAERVWHREILIGPGDDFADVQAN